jgi:hypothetical protein
MTLTERVADFMATSQPGDAIALSKDGDVETGTGVLLLCGQDGFSVQLCYRQPVPTTFDPALILARSEVLCHSIGTTLDS